MPERSFPFDTEATYQNDWLRFARLFTPSAVVGSPGTGAYDLTLSGFSASLSCRSDQSPAEAFVDGSMHQITYDAATSGRVALTVTPNADPANSRIDRVVLRRDPAARSVVLAILPGTPAASPVAATPTQIAGGLFEFPLWRFTVPPNSASTTSNPVDDRYYREAATGWQGIGAWGSGTSLPSSPADGTRYYHTGVRCTLTYAGGSWRQDDLPSVADAATMAALQTSYPTVVYAGFQAFRQDLGQVWTWTGGQWQAAGSATQVDVVTTSGTWTKPSGAKTVRVIAVGGGGGGGGGGSTTQPSTYFASNGYAAGGGGGGGGGGMEDLILDASSLPATVAVAIGAGGAGGAGSSVINASQGYANGAIGTAGGVTTFGTYLTAGSGGGGSGGVGGSSSSTAGGGGASTAFYQGGNGGAGQSYTNPGSIGATSRGAGGGGGGGSGFGGIGYAGGAGGMGSAAAPATVVAGGPAGGAQATATGNAGANAIFTARYAGGGGGGGSGASSATASSTAGVGGVGVYGGGGGGGGGAENYPNLTATGAAGGKGGNGVVVCISYF